MTWKSEWYFFGSINKRPPSVAANLLSQIPKGMTMFEGASIALSNKVANAQDIKSARVTFDVLKKTDLEGGLSGLLLALQKSQCGCQLVEQMMIEFECNPKCCCSNTWSNDEMWWKSQEFIQI